MTPTTAASHEQEVVVPVACGHLRPANRDLGGENPDGRRLRRQIEGGEPLEFGHTLEDQIGGQIAAGFVITGFYEDRHSDDPIAAHMPTLIATRATKP